MKRTSRATLVLPAICALGYALGCGSINSSGDASSGDGSGRGGSGGSGQCPSGQVWCPGCTPGTGACYAGGCPGVACPPIDAGCTGGACPVTDASVTCADVTTLEACDARADCHAVFVDPHDCPCLGLGCCARFSRCADGDKAKCAGVVACGALAPYCEGPTYVVSFTDACYEGCVRATDCAP